MKKFVALLVCLILLLGMTSAVAELKDGDTVTGTVGNIIFDTANGPETGSTLTLDNATINGYFWLFGYTGFDLHLKLKGENVITGGPCDDFYYEPDCALLLESDGDLYFELEEGASLRIEGTVRRYANTDYFIVPADCPTSGEFRGGNFVIGPRPTSTPVPTATPVPAPPATGDGADPALWLALAALMLAGMLALRRRAAVR